MYDSALMIFLTAVTAAFVVYYVLMENWIGECGPVNEHVRTRLLAGVTASSYQQGQGAGARKPLVTTQLTQVCV